MGGTWLQDIKQRYRRSVLGPLWISITMAVIATAMGILYGALFGADLPMFLPYVATGLLIWNFINGAVLEAPRSSSPTRASSGSCRPR